MRYVVLTLALLLVSAPAAAHHSPGPCDVHWRYERLADEQEAVRRLIRCSTRRWSVPGGYTQARDVARCESGLQADPGGSHLGVYQHSPTYWPGRAARWLRPRWDIPPNGLNARANVIVTMRMVHSMQSWRAWSCA